MSPSRNHTRSALGATVVFLILLGAFYLLVSFSGRSPVIRDIEPSAARPGETVEILGEHFGESRGRSKVRLAGSIPTSSAYRSWSDTRIVLELPEDITSGLAYVETDRGRSNGVLFANVEHIPRGHAEDDSSARPIVESVNPEAARVGEIVTLRGNRFGTNRNDARVYFSWRSERGERGRLPVEDDGHGYAYWSGREIRVRVPDGATTGRLVVETARGESEAREIEIVRDVGEKRFTGGRTHAVAVSVTVDSVQLAENADGGTIYLWVPRIAQVPQQRNRQTLTESAVPLFSRVAGVDLYRIRDPEPETSWSMRRSLLFERYGVETEIDVDAVTAEYGRSEAFLRHYTQPNELLPVEAEPLMTAASEIYRTARNPYVLARRTYEYVVENLEPLDRVGSVGALEALETGMANSHGYATLLASLLRAQEIPARLVGGYLVGSAAAGNERGEVSRHYWAEFYVDGLGWVPVDPAAADGIVPASFPLPEEPGAYYFGNVDDARFAFSYGLISVPRMHPEGRTDRIDTMYSVQSHHQEAAGDIRWYRVRWHDIEYLGEY